jgi:hypothetical protein
MKLSKGSDNTFRKGRFWLYLDKKFDRSINFEYVLWTSFFGANIKLFDGDGDRDLQFHFACGLFAFWLTFEDLLPRRWQPDYKKRFSSTREIGFSIHDQCIWISLWEDPMGWSKSQPWWWSFTLHPVDWIFGKTQYSTREIRSFPNIPLKICEHEVYPAKVRLFESTWKRPRWRARKIVRAEVEVEGGVTHPGKGTMSYNCGDDALFSLTTPASSAKEALAKFRDSVLDMRERYPL